MQNSQFHSNGEGLLAFFSSMDLRQGCLPSSLLFDSILEILAYIRSQQIKSIQIKKEKNKIVFTHRNIIYKEKENPKESTKKLLRTSVWVTVTRTIQLIVFLYNGKNRLEVRT